MPTRLTNIAAFFLLALCAACTRQPHSTSEVPRHIAPGTRVAVAPFTQPMHPGQLITGQIPRDQGRIPRDELLALDMSLRDVLVKDTSRQYTFIPRRNPVQDYTSSHSTGQPSALPRWIAYGREHDVQLLLVPQVLDWHQREGSGAGVTSPAHVRVEFFLISVDNDALMDRSVYEETQVGLVDNLLAAGSFFRRGAAWVKADDLAREGMRKAVTDLGL